MERLGERERLGESERKRERKRKREKEEKRKGVSPVAKTEDKEQTSQTHREGL